MAVEEEIDAVGFQLGESWGLEGGVSKRVEKELCQVRLGWNGHLRRRGLLRGRRYAVRMHMELPRVEMV